MENVVYCLKKKKDTKELHLFEAVPSSENKCVPAKVSVCEKMKKEDSVENIFTCISEDDARIKCAIEGRSVCGSCVSHLYETYK